MNTFVLQEEVSMLRSVLPLLEGWGSFVTVSDVFMYRESVLAEIHERKCQIEDHSKNYASVLSVKEKNLIGSLFRVTMKALDYEYNTITGWLVAHDLEEAREITPASNTGVEVYPHA